MDFNALLNLALLVIKVLTPVVDLIVNAVATGKDVTEALAAESVADILPAEGHLDAAMAMAHANRAANELYAAHYENGETAGMTPRQLAIIELALAKHALVSVVN